MQAGIQPVMINVREKDQMKQQKAYLGAVLKMGDKSDAIPFMQPGAAMEYALSSSIKKLSVEEKPTLGLLQGHGEPTLQAIQQANQALSILYNVEMVTMSDTASIPDRIRTLVIIPLSVIGDFEQRGALGGELRHHLAALLLAVDQGKLGHRDP